MARPPSTPRLEASAVVAAQPPPSDDAGPPHSETPAVVDLTPVIGRNLRRLRRRRGLSLERLAKASGVSRAMLGQIELERSTPTINVVWKIATALDVPLFVQSESCMRSANSWSVRASGALARSPGATA
jgi:DNA-binding XRE family transcriptional regulator